MKIVWKRLGLLAASFGVALASVTAAALAVAPPALPQPAEIDGQPVRAVLLPDTIPALDEPAVFPGREAQFLRGDERVLGVVAGGEARAYSLEQLNDHEIVNDFLGGRPIAATW